MPIPEKYEVMPWLFLVKINKEEQKAFKEKISKNSPFFMPVDQIHNARNMEHGEIVQIGERLRGTDKCWDFDRQENMCEWGIYGWEDCKVGHTLIFHHTIEQHETSKDRTAQYWVFDDETHNYYVVDYFNVRGFYDGEKITPHPNFVFLKNIPAFVEDGEDVVNGNKVKKSEGGILLITKWDESASDIAQKSERIKEHIESLTKSKRTPEMQLVLESMEEERIQLNRKAQKKMFLPYRVAWSNKKLDRDFGRKLVEDDVLYCFNKACLYVSNFQDKEYSYIIALTEHVGFLYHTKSWLQMEEEKAREEFMDESREEIGWCQNLIKNIDWLSVQSEKLPEQTSKDFVQRCNWLIKDAELIRDWVSKNKKENKRAR